MAALALMQRMLYALNQPRYTTVVTDPTGADITVSTCYVADGDRWETCLFPGDAIDRYGQDQVAAQAGHAKACAEVIKGTYEHVIYGRE
jgi:hypothetical protein